MADADALKNYIPNPYPTIPGGEAIYITDELANIRSAFDRQTKVIKLLEARILALE